MDSKTNKIVIAVQGQASFVHDLKNAWGEYPIIWSTWVGSEKFFDKEDNVIYNDIPPYRGVGNINLQKISTLNAIKKAKELGFTRVLKWRSDMVPTNPKELIALFSNGLNISYFHNTMPHKKGYYVDYVMEGDVDLMEKIWSFDELNGPHAEAIITSSIEKCYTEKINLFGNGLSQTNDILWIKKKILLSTYNLHKEYESNFYTK